jgi:hypothetical protein
VLLPLAAAAWLAVAAARMPILTPDVWWHLATGRLIAARGIPRHDPFSYTLSGAAWTVHEWLADRIVFAAARRRRLVGSRGPARRAARGRGGAGVPAGAPARLAASWRSPGSRSPYGPRSATGSTARSCGAMRSCPSSCGCSSATGCAPSRWVWSLPLVFVLWVNLHGSFLLGLAVVAIWLVARWKTQPVRRAAPLLAACAAATLINPHGIGRRALSAALRRHRFGGGPFARSAPAGSTAATRGCMGCSCWRGWRCSQRAGEPCRVRTGRSERCSQPCRCRAWGAWRCLSLPNGTRRFSCSRRYRCWCGRSRPCCRRLRLPLRRAVVRSRGRRQPGSPQECSRPSRSGKRGALGHATRARRRGSCPVASRLRQRLGSRRTIFPCAC